MKRIMTFAVAGAVAICCAAALAVAADSGKAKVGDLVGAIAAKKGVSTAQVQNTLETKSGRKLNLDATLDQSLAASLLSDLGVPLSASRKSEMTVSDVNRLGSLLTFTRVSAEDTGGDGREPGEVVNKGRKTRSSGNSPNSNADVNAFESLREDPRD